MQHAQQQAKLALVTEGTFAALVYAFMRSPKWTTPQAKGGYSDSTRETWGRELIFAARKDLLGPTMLTDIRPSLVQAFFDGIADRPSKQSVSLTALRQLEGWALVRDYLPRTITTGVEVGRSTGGHVPWNDEQVGIGERHAAPHLSMAITLGANTGQRGSDLVRMRPTDITTHNGIDGITIRQQKTGKLIWVPITSPLAAAMKTWPRRPGPFLRNAIDLPWERKQLSSAWDYERDKNPDLRPLGREAVKGHPTNDSGLVLHGLRATACVRLKRAGANTVQISDMVGMSLQMVERYCRMSNQQENASAAVHILERTLSEQAARNAKNVIG